MSTRQVVGPVIVGRISPATVWMRNVSESVQPERRRYMIASRAPLPDSSASLPSGLKMRRLATNPRSVGGEQLEHAVGADAEVRVAEPSDAAGAERHGQRVALHDQVVVAQRLPLLEAHGAHHASRARTAACRVAAVSSGERSVTSISSVSGSLRIQVSWRRA